NSDKSFTWEKVTGVSKSGASSAVIQNYNYAANDQKDYLRLPEVNLANSDSAFITFHVAASATTALTTANNVWDTLEVLISTDCGISYQSLYKKWGANLITTAGVADKFFIPSVAEWRKDSINITSFISRGNVLIAFRNTNEYENNIYLDNVNVYTKVINPNLKAKGFLLTPVPVGNMVTVQFYPQPTNLRSLAIYTILGQKLYEVNTSSGASNFYQFDMSRNAAGVYIFRATFTDRVITRKFVKGN
ncbi:MAG: choice-of-anchor J domain-containing protein, partial [Chitinophagaceae bacterium]